MPAFAFQLNPAARDLGACSAILNGRATRYHVERYRTTTSIKAVQSGAAHYVTPGSRHLVTPDSFLVLNDGQEYGLDFDWPTNTETLCPFFQCGFIEHVAFSMSLPVRKHLDEIEGYRQVGFFERLYPRTGRINAILNDIHQRINAKQACAIWLEDRMWALAEGPIELSGMTRQEVDAVSAERPATRDELYRRLHRGRDYLSACYAEPVTVSAAAAAARLSPHHFHRQFKAVCGQSPMQFVQSCRLSAAKRLLMTTDLPVTQICFSVGYESLGSFSSLFHRRFGRPPRHFRRTSELG